jgi:hypothetical protein
VNLREKEKEKREKGEGGVKRRKRSEQTKRRKGTFLPFLCLIKKLPFAPSSTPPKQKKK